MAQPQIDYTELPDTEEIDYSGLPRDNQQPSRLSQIWNTLSEPVTNKISEFSKSISDYVNPDNETKGLRGIGSAYIEGLGNTIEGLLSPLNIGTTLATAGVGPAAETGLPKIAQLLKYAGSVPLIGEGGYHAVTGATLPEKLMGGLEAAGGISGIRSRVPKIAESILGKETLPNVDLSIRHPDLVAVGDENITSRPKSLNPEEVIYENAKKKFNMGLTPEDKQLTPGKPIIEPKPKFADLTENQVNDIFSKPPNSLTSYQTNPKGKQLLQEPRLLEGNGPPNKPPIINSNPPEPISPKAEPIIRRIKDKEYPEASIINEAWNLSRGLMSVDLPFITSAAFRQGLPLIGTKNWFKAWIPSIKSYGSKKFYEAHLRLLDSDPLNVRPTVPILMKDGNPLIRNGQSVLKETPSVFDDMGIELSDTKRLDNKEELIRSTLAEKIPIYGRLIAANNRAYTAYINELRTSTARNFYEAMPDKNNLVAMRELGDAVNAFTGKGSLKQRIPFTDKNINLEKYASAASNILFAPKLIASRVQMINPMNYTSTAPQVRKEYLKALTRTAGAWMTFASLGKLSGANISLDPTNSDFGKIKVGNFRLDPAGGFQQYLVLMSRLSSGKSTSSTKPNETKDLNRAKSIYDPTRGSVATNFIENKLHPSLKYFYDAAFANKSRSFPAMDRAIQLTIPMITKDLIDLANEEPELVPFMAPLISAGMGGQYYEKGGDFNKSVIIPKENDIILGR